MSPTDLITLTMTHDEFAALIAIVEIGSDMSDTDCEVFPGAESLLGKVDELMAVHSFR